MSQDRQQKNTMTRECIFTALLLLMEQKPYEDITITEIARKAGVSRMSYYRLYRSKDDIFVQRFNEIFEELVGELEGMRHISRYQFGLLLFRKAKIYHQIMEGVYSARLYEVVLQCFIEYCAYLVWHMFPQDMEEWERDYLVYELAGKFCMILFRWIQKGMKETPEEMASLLEKRLSDY